ncbi:3'-5' exonuclease [Pontibacter pamirensis]|uniref:3'-5' exonuclease n=1 Tax=Pontibacter pamirensis TaxID=2562824 RepID=UPI00138A335B|nr:3'-5' exonuclease [Pontibacter pamirensis]
MREYLLFIDTETTGIPKDWNAPYSDHDSWPVSVQVAWAIYTKDGQEVKLENFYVRDDDFEISPESIKIHGITSAFLQEKGVQREEVLTQLSADLNQYQPLVIAHFMQLDYHMVGVCFHRAGMYNPLPELPLFCTMRASSNFLLRPHQRFLRLGEMYERLFNVPLKHQHNAMVDARATAKCFFELVKRGDIDEGMIARQQADSVEAPAADKKTGCGGSVLFMFVISLLLSYWI